MLHTLMSKAVWEFFVGNPVFICQNKIYSNRACLTKLYVTYTHIKPFGSFLFGIPFFICQNKIFSNRAYLTKLYVTYTHIIEPFGSFFIRNPVFHLSEQNSLEYSLSKEIVCYIHLYRAVWEFFIRNLVVYLSEQNFLEYSLSNEIVCMLHTLVSSRLGVFYSESRFYLPEQNLLKQSLSNQIVCTYTHIEPFGSFLFRIPFFFCQNKIFSNRAYVTKLYVHTLILSRLGVFYSEFRFLSVRIKFSLIEPI